jgi:hypothetical protein
VCVCVCACVCVRVCVCACVCLWWWDIAACAASDVDVEVVGKKKPRSEEFGFADLLSFADPVRLPSFLCVYVGVALHFFSYRPAPAAVPTA